MKNLTVTLAVTYTSSK